MTKLEKLLNDKAVNVSALSRKVGVSPSTVQNWLKGRSRIPAEAALVIASVYDVDVDRVIGNVESRKRVAV